MQVLYEGAPVYTLWEQQPSAEALVVENGEILAVGDRAGLRDRYPGARRVALEGAAVIPAFNDCHCHVLILGQDLGKADVRACRSIPEIGAVLREWADAHPDKPWIIGRNYEHNALVEGRHLSRADLDALGLDRPVYVVQISGHCGVIDSKAMAAAGIEAGSADPADGEIHRDEHGEPTGLLLEGARRLVKAALPKPTLAEMTAAIERALSHMADRGILAASEAAFGRQNWDLEWRAYARALEDGAPGRLTVMPDFEKAEEMGWFDAPLAPGGLPPDAAAHPRLGLGPIKLFADGVLTAYTAALEEPYAGETSRGMLMMPEEELLRRIGAVHRNGYQCCAHAIGDRAIGWMLEGYRRAQAERPRADARHRIEHCLLATPEQIRAMAELGIIAVTQPEFLYWLVPAYRKVLGLERARRILPAKSWVDAGVPVAFSSDQPVVPGDPIEGWRAAVTRRTREGVVFGGEECVSWLDALRAYTTTAAHATFDATGGRLAPGCRADFVVLSHRPEEIEDPEMRVITTSYRLAKDLG